MPVTEATWEEMDRLQREMGDPDWDGCMVYSPTGGVAAGEEWVESLEELLDPPEGRDAAPVVAPDREKPEP